MGKIFLDVAVSLDGFTADKKNNSIYPIHELQKTPALNELIRSTGAVIMGRRTYNMAKGDFTGYEYQVPIFVLTHNAPKKVTKGENENLRFTFVKGNVKNALKKAKAAAGDRNVMVIGGANTAQQCIKSNLLDEILIRQMPVLLNEGLQLFTHFRHKEN